MPLDTELRVKEVIQRAYNVKSIRLEVPGDTEYKAGQFLRVTLNNDPDLKRYLSISSSPTEKCYIEFTKKLTASDFSRALDSLKTGDLVRVQYPMGNFTLKDGFGKIAFISGGIGITPIRSIAKYVVDKKLGIDMILVYANRSVKDIVFKDDFDYMQKAYPHLKVAHVLCETEPGFKCTVGLINQAVIKNEVPDYRERKFYLCGPPAMVESMKKMLTGELGLQVNDILTENFQGY